MTKAQALKKIRKYISIEAELGFDQRVLLLRAVDDVKLNINREKDNLDTILLRLRYGVNQRVPYAWTQFIEVPSEEKMAGGLVEKPVSKGYVIRGGEYPRPERIQKSIKKTEREIAKPVGRKLAIV